MQLHHDKFRDAYRARSANTNPPKPQVALQGFLGSFLAGTSQPELLLMIPGLLPIIVAHVTVVQGLDVPGGNREKSTAQTMS